MWRRCRGCRRDVRHPFEGSQCDSFSSDRLLDPETVRRSEIDVYPENLRKFSAKSFQGEEACSRIQIHRKINVTSWSIFTTRDTSENAHVARTVSRRTFQYRTSVPLKPTTKRSVWKISRVPTRTHFDSHEPDCEGRVFSPSLPFLGSDNKRMKS